MKNLKKLLVDRKSNDYLFADEIIDGYDLATFKELKFLSACGEFDDEDYDVLIDVKEGVFTRCIKEIKDNQGNTYLFDSGFILLEQI